jgi:DNA modification methylase
VPKSETSFERARYGYKKSAQRNKDGTSQAPGNQDTFFQPNKIPDSIVRIWKDTEGYGDHPAVFPVGFPEFVIKTWSDQDNIIFEPFAGSGTTLVACQNLSRKCRAIEISEKYCSVILERMATAFPGIEIELLL